MDSNNLIREFKLRHNTAIVPFYEDREDRNRWAASVVKTFSGDRLLNLGGGGKRHLGKHLAPKWNVHEVDITGDCDTKLNLDEIDRLPFEDNCFDTCCAFEVLEHLENFHLVFEEMYRVSNSTLFISLPNAAIGAYRILRNQSPPTDPLKNGVYQKFYGLPLHAPEDRHRWWLTFEDIVRYFVWFEEKESCKVEFYIPQPDATLKRKLFRFVLGERIFLNFLCSNVWIRIEKN